MGKELSIGKRVIDYATSGWKREPNFLIVNSFEELSREDRYGVVEF